MGTLFRSAEQAKPAPLESVDLVLDLIERLATAPGPLGVSDLARDLGASKARTHRHLRALVGRGYARQDPATWRYAIGARLTALAEQARGAFGVLDAIRPQMAELRDSTGLAVTVSLLTDGAVTVIDMLPGRALIDFGIRPGARLALCGSAHGLVALAFGPASTREATLGEAADPKALAAEVGRVRRQGWATAPGRVLEGVNALAAPVFDHLGELRAALAIVGSTRFISAAPAADQLAALMAAAGRASHALGWTGEGA